MLDSPTFIALLGGLIFVAALLVGINRPWVPMVALAWSIPYIAGNFIVTIPPPPTPARPIAFAVALLAVYQNARKKSRLGLLRERVYLLLGICVLFGGVGLVLTYLQAPFIDQWRQPPEVRVLRAGAAEALCWLLMFAPAALACEGTTARRLLRHVLYAGALYSGLGILQFAIGQLSGVDIFPISREALGDSGLIAQSFVADTSASRITSLCGEPRYLAAYACLWLLLTTTLGKPLGLSRRFQYSLCLLFLITTILTGSRTAIVILTLGGLAAVVAAGAFGNTRLVVRLAGVALAVGFLGITLVVYQVGSFGERNAATQMDDSNSIEVADIRIPFEWQDLAGIYVLARHPSRLAIGFGPGLWQYYEDPWQWEYTRRYRTSAVLLGSDSVQPNIRPLARLCDYGGVGLALAVATWMALYSRARHGLQQGARLQLAMPFAVIVAFLQAAGYAELLGFFAIGLTTQLFVASTAFAPSRQKASNSSGPSASRQVLPTSEYPMEFPHLNGNDASLHS